MKVALVADPQSPHTRAWVRGMMERGLEVCLFSPHKEAPGEDIGAPVHAPLASPALPAGISRPERPPAGGRTAGETWELRSITRALRLAPAFRKWLHRTRPDRLVALRFQPEGYLASMGAFHPLILVSWGQDVLWFAREHPLHRFFARRAVRAADLLVAETHAVAEAMRRDLGARSDRCVREFLGIEADYWAGARGRLPEIRRARPEWTSWLDQAAQGSPVVFSPRAIGFHGHQRELVRAWAGLAAPSSAPSLLLQAGAGAPEDRAECAALAASLGAGNRYYDLGPLPVEAVREVCSLADIAVSLWSPDGLSQSLLETMAAGLLPIAADLPGNREWIRPGENGLVVDPHDPLSIRDALGRALADPAWRHTAGESNVTLIRGQADRAQHLDRLCALIRETMKPAGGRRSREA